MPQHKDIKSVDKFLEEKLSQQSRPVDPMIERLKKIAQSNKFKRF